MTAAIPENERYWDAAAAGDLLVGQCTACGKTHFYPRALCPHCFSDAVAWVVASGDGVIYSFSTMVRAKEPYVIAYVTLAEGVTMLSNIVDADPATLAIGQPVRLRFVDGRDGRRIAMFAPAGAAA